MMGSLYDDRDAAVAAAEKIKIFAQPQRLMILSCLLQGERNVGEIAALTGIGQPALSQQLAELRRADMVQTRKEAKQVWYMLAHQNVALCVRNIEAMFGGTGIPELPSDDHAFSQKLPPDRMALKKPSPGGVAKFARIVG